MATTPGIGLQFQPSQALQGFPQQAIGLNQLGQQQRKQQQIMQLNQIPGMVEGGIYTDNGIMALSQIDPGMRDEAVQKRATILNMQSQERYRKAQEDKIRDAERTEMLTDIMSNVYSAYSGTPGSEEARKQALATKLSEEVEAMVKDGRAAKYGMTPQQIAQFRSHTSPDDILVKLLKHRPKEAEFYQAREGARALAGDGAIPTAAPPVTGGDTGGTTPAATVSLADVGTDGAQTKPYAAESIDGTALPDRPVVPDEEFEKQAAEWEKYEKKVQESWLKGEISVENYENRLAEIDAEKERIKAGREKIAALDAQVKEGVKTPDTETLDTGPDDLIAKARDAETKAKKLRATGMPANIKQAEAYDKQAKKYRDQAQRNVGLEQNERRLDQAQQRIKISVDKASSTQQPLSEEALDFAAEQYVKGLRTAITGFARNQTAMKQLRERIPQIAKKYGMGPEEVNAKIAEFTGIEAESRTVGNRAGQIAIPINEMKTFIPLAESASNAVERSQWLPLNKLAAYLRTQAGSPEQKNLLVQTQAVRNAYAQIASRGGISVHSQMLAEENLLAADSPAAYNAALRAMWSEAEAAAKAVQGAQMDVQRRATGKPLGEEPYPGSAAGAPVSRETPKAATPAKPAAPQVGEIRGSAGSRYRYKGGDPAKESSWEPVK